MTTSARAPMDATRKAALAAGLFYIATFVFSIPALGLYDGVLNDPRFVLGAGGDGGVLWGGLIEVLTGLAGIGTAVAVYPVIRRLAPARAVGFVASRTLEAAVIVVGVVAVLSVDTLRQGGGDPAALTTTSDAFVALKDWTFLVGPGVMPAVNALCFATVVRQHNLVARWIPTLGYLGGPLLLASSVGTLFGAWDQVSPVAMLMALPVGTWELAVGITMAVKGFRPGAPTADAASSDALGDADGAPSLLAPA